MTLAFKANIPTAQKIVLLALCDCANDQGECYPSVTTLMEKTSMSDRGVQKAVAQLEEFGMLRREFRNGRATVYWMTPSAKPVENPRTMFTPERGSPPNVVRPTPEPCSPPPPNVVHPTPEPCSPRTITESSIESSRKQKTVRGAVLARPDGVDPQVWSDFLRQRKKAFTQTALNGISREAIAAGLTLESALRIAVERGWESFKAEWLKPAPRASPSDAKARERERIVRELDAWKTPKPPAFAGETIDV